MLPAKQLRVPDATTASLRRLTMVLLACLPACGAISTETAHLSPHNSPSPPPCGMPPPVPAPWLALVYPEPGAANVPVSIRQLVLAGNYYGYYDNAAVTMTAGDGMIVPVGAYTAAPSPLPSPHATPAQGTPYVAVPVPTLSPATTYALSYTFTDFNGIPPACTGPVTWPLGSFSTG